MLSKKVKWAAVFISAVVILSITNPASASSEQSRSHEHQVAGELSVISPLSVQMLDETIAILSKGWVGMDAAEQELFLKIYDPSDCGDIDESFVTAVRENYVHIRHAFDDEVPMQYEPRSRLCKSMRLYYTDLVTLHVCPYFLTEEREWRKARTLIHEYAHIALYVMDRPYYRADSKAYAQLTPRGSQSTQLPIIGPVIREIAASDTLYHPDAYAHFALAVSGGSRTMAMYGIQSAGYVAEHDVETLQQYVGSNPAADSWG